jgi:hypothetical protein
MPGNRTNVQGARENTSKNRASNVPASIPPKLKDSESRDWPRLAANFAAGVLVVTVSFITTTFIHPVSPPLFEYSPLGAS